MENTIIKDIIRSIEKVRVWKLDLIKSIVSVCNFLRLTVTLRIFLFLGNTRETSRGKEACCLKTIIVAQKNR